MELNSEYTPHLPVSPPSRITSKNYIQSDDGRIHWEDRGPSGILMWRRVQVLHHGVLLTNRSRDPRDAIVAGPLRSDMAADRGRNRLSQLNTTSERGRTQLRLHGFLQGEIRRGRVFLLPRIIGLSASGTSKAVEPIEQPFPLRTSFLLHSPHLRLHPPFFLVVVRRHPFQFHPHLLLEPTGLLLKLPPKLLILFFETLCYFMSDSF